MTDNTAATYPNIIKYESRSNVLTANINIEIAGTKSVNGIGNGKNNRNASTILTRAFNCRNCFLVDN